MVRFLQPRVIKLGETKVDDEGVTKMMKEYGEVAEEWLSTRKGTWHSGGEQLIEIAGRACYRSFGKGLNPNITQVRAESKDYFENVLKKGDGSILEHSTVTFALMWVSRVLTHQLVRHRAGTAFSQESLRYVRATEVAIPEFSSWAPEGLGNGTRKKMEKALNAVETHYRQIDDGISWDGMSFSQKKGVTSAIRRMLPQGMATVIILTANHRALRWMIEMRTDPAAEIEIRKVFGKIAEICLRDYPLLYGDFKKMPLEDGSTHYKPQLRSKV
jgi:thymidylate synthase (FAD)